MRTWDLLSELPIEIHGYELVPHEIPFPTGESRRTTVVRLKGGDLDGLGEDVTYQADAQGIFQDAGPEQPLTGSTTLAGFARLLDGLDLWPGADSQPNAPLDYRRWAFESAALDLALRQSGLSLADAFRRELRPLRFGVSFGLGTRRPRRASTRCAHATRARTSSSTRRAPGRGRWRTSSPPPARSTSSTSRATTSARSSTSRPTRPSTA